MKNNSSIVLSGIRPTGNLHLGNYLGAVQNFVQMQDNYSCFFFVADLLYLTTHKDTENLMQSSKNVIIEYLACGINPSKATLYIQSMLPEISELYLILNMLAYKGELEKTASFKEKIKIQKENINAGLLTYPVLMAADILIHRASLVPVGKDQEQHLEMTRNFANRFNHRFHSEVFPEPQPVSFNKELTKILSLDGSGKMSKSIHSNSTIYLTDENDFILKKIKKVPTDAGPQVENSQMPDTLKNLFTILKHCSEASVYEYFLAKYKDCSIRYGDLKQAVAEGVINLLNPIKEKMVYFQNEEKMVRKLLEEGDEKAKISANATMKKVKEAIQLNL